VTLQKKIHPTALPKGRPPAANAPTGPRRVWRPSAHSAINAGTPMTTTITQ
jgi:hypothetical protein